MEKRVKKDKRKIILSKIRRIEIKKEKSDNEEQEAEELEEIIKTPKMPESSIILSSLEMNENTLEEELSDIQTNTKAEEKSQINDISQSYNPLNSNENSYFTSKGSYELFQNPSMSTQVNLRKDFVNKSQEDLWNKGPFKNPNYPGLEERRYETNFDFEEEKRKRQKRMWSINI